MNTAVSRTIQTLVKLPHRVVSSLLQLFREHFGVNGEYYVQYSLLGQSIITAIQLVSLNTLSQSLDWSDVLLYMSLISVSIAVYPLLLLHRSHRYRVDVFILMSFCMDFFFFFANMRKSTTFETNHSNGMGLFEAFAIVFPAVRISLLLHFYQYAHFFSLLIPPTVAFTRARILSEAAAMAAFPLDHRQQRKGGGGGKGTAGDRKSVV